MKAVVFTLGCKVNQYESQALINMLSESGHETSNALSCADLYVINTCSVTSEADKKSRQAVSRALKFNPDARVVILGCSSQNDRKQYLNKPNVVAVSGNSGKLNALEQALDILNKSINDSVNMSVEESGFVLPKEYENDGILYHSDKTRAVIKIQDGCNRFCSYCIIPYLRGRSRSRNLEDIVSEAQELSLKTKEIVITGIDTSAYGLDIGLDLTTLVGALSKMDCRKRLGSLECGVIDERLLSALKESGFCAHFHLSLQSGSSTVLKRMNRRYTAEEYMQKVELIRKYFPLAGITTDIIAGFCSETDDEHRQTVEFVKAAEFSDIHVFPFSARKGTRAFSMPAVNEKVKAERVKELLEIKEQLKTAFLSKNIGQISKVYIEQTEKDYNFGFTENYIKIYSKAPVHSLINHELIKTYKDGLSGEIAD